MRRRRARLVPARTRAALHGRGRPAGDGGGGAPPPRRPRHDRGGDLNTYEPAVPSPLRPCSARSTTRTTAPRSSPGSPASPEEARLRPDPRQYRLDDVSGRARCGGIPRVELRPFFVPQTRRLPAPAIGLLRARALGAARAAGPPRAVHLRRRGTPLAARRRTRRGRRARDALPDPGSISAGTSVDRLGAPRAVGRRRRHHGADSTPWDAGCHSRSRAIAGCLSAPRPGSPIRTRATPGRRTSSGQNVSRERRHDRVSVPDPVTSKRLYAARAGRTRLLHPDDPPVRACPRLVRPQADRAVEPDERGVSRPGWSRPARRLPRRRSRPARSRCAGRARASRRCPRGRA